MRIRVLVSDFFACFHHQRMGWGVRNRLTARGQFPVPSFRSGGESDEGGGRVRISASPSLVFRSWISHVGIARRGLGAWTLFWGQQFGLNVKICRAHLVWSLYFSNSFFSRSIPHTISPHLHTPLPVDVWRSGQTPGPRRWSLCRQRRENFTRSEVQVPQKNNNKYPKNIQSIHLREKRLLNKIF